MTLEAGPTVTVGESDPSLSLYQLLYPEVLANPYPLYHRLRTEDPVHWDPFLHTWVVTRYEDAVTVLQHSQPPAHRRQNSCPRSACPAWRHWRRCWFARCSFSMRRLMAASGIWQRQRSRPGGLKLSDLTSRRSSTPF